MAYPIDDPRPGRSREPEPARSRTPRARLLDQGRHLRRLHRGPPRRRPRRERVRLLRRPALRQRPAALRPPPHRLREGHRPALPDHARQAGRAPLRLGLPRPARRARGREGAGLTGQADIEDYGVERFNEHCRDLGDAVHAATGSDYVNRQARWVDFENDYKTMDLSFMESVMWAFKTALGQGPDLRGLPRRAVFLGCETPLSQFRDPPRRLLPGPPGPGAHRRPSSSPTPARLDGAKLLAWTTTPWTLPSNLALAVHPDADYAVVEARGSS